MQSDEGGRVKLMRKLKEIDDRKALEILAYLGGASCPVSSKDKTSVARASDISETSS